MSKISHSNPALDNVLGQETNGKLSRRGCGLFDISGRLVAATGDDETHLTAEEQELWAKRIETCVNSHEDLLTACRYALGHLLHDSKYQKDDALWSCVSHFIRAINKAEGK